MRIVIKVDKNLFLFIIILVLIMFSISFSFGQGTIDKSRPWHPLQQITTDSTGSISVDADADGLIDNVEELTLPACAFCQSVGGQPGCGVDYPFEAGRLLDQRYRFEDGVLKVPDDIEITGLSEGCVLPMVTDPNRRNEFSLCCRA